MKYLRELIKKISQNDFELLKIQNFTATEKKLLVLYRNDKKELDDEFLATQLSIKPSTLKKLQSKLLFDVLKVLSSENILDQITFLAKVNCHRILLHIAKGKISQYKKEKKTEDLAALYLDIPNKLLGAVFTDYDIKDIYKFRKEYMILKPEVNFESVKLEILTHILHYMKFTSFTEKDAKWFAKEFPKIDTLGNPELEFWKNSLIGDYYDDTDEEKYFEIVKRNIELVNNNVFDFNEKIIINCKLQYCFCLISENKFQETYQYYKQLSEEYPKIIGSAKGLRYTDLIAQVCIVLGKYDEARKYILEVYPIEIDEPGKFAEMYFGNTTILAMLDILEENYDKAHKKIQSAKIGLKKQYFIFLDSLLRVVEQAYYFKVKDYEFSDSLYQKNIKFYQYHENEGLDTLVGAHRIIAAYAKQEFDKKPLSEKCKEFQNELDKGDYAFIGHFIKKLV